MKSIFFLIAFSLFVQGLAQNLASGLQACYPMDCTAQNFATTGAALNGTAVNLTCTIGHLGQTGTAYQFSGDTNSYFRVPGTALTKPSGSITVSGWYRPTNPSFSTQYCFFTRKSNCTFNNWEAYYLAVIPGGGGNIFRAGKGSFGSNCGTHIASSSTITIGNWYHVVFYIDNGTVDLYVNGVLVSQSTPHSSAFDYFTGTDVILGGAANSYHYLPFTGSIDNVRFYDRKLTTQEINNLYTLDPSCTGATVSPPVSAFAFVKGTICAKKSVLFTDNSTNQPLQWNWQFQGGFPSTSNLSNPTIVFPNPGTYTVSLIASNLSGPGNVNTQTIVVSSCNALEDEEGFNNELVVYPNPSNDLVTLSAQHQQLVSVKVMDFTGKVVAEQSLTENRNEIQISELPAALYILEVQTASNKIIRKRFVKL